MVGGGAWGKGEKWGGKIERGGRGCNRVSRERGYLGDLTCRWPARSGWTANGVEKERFAGRARRAVRCHIQPDRHRWVLNSLRDLGSKPLAGSLPSFGESLRQSKHDGQFCCPSCFDCR